MIKKSMNLAVYVTIGIITLVLSACSNKPTTIVDFNSKTNFTNLNSFQFAPQAKLSLDANPIMLTRIQSLVEQALIRKGLTLVEFQDNKSADLTIKVNYKQQEKPNNSSFTIGLGTGRVSSSGGGSIGVSTSVPINSDSTIITYVIIDMSHHGEAVWHGTDQYESNSSMTVGEVNNLASVTITRLLEKFPPNAK